MTTISTSRNRDEVIQSTAGMVWKCWNPVDEGYHFNSWILQTMGEASAFRHIQAKHILRRRRLNLGPAPRIIFRLRSKFGHAYGLIPGGH